MKKAVIVVIGMIFIVGCSSGSWFAQKKTVVIPSQKITTKHCKLSPFKSIVINGNAKVELANGPYRMNIRGVQADSYNCKQGVVDRVLHISDMSGQDSGLTVKLSVPELEKITVTGNAAVRGSKIKANKLALVAKDNGAISLKGRFNVNKVFQKGNGRINIDWVDTDFIQIEGSGDGPIYLAGVAKKSLIKLANKANLNARYLRTEKSSVFTADESLAEVWASDNLDAHAVDKSNIYYYKMPEDLNTVTRDAANVLHPDWIR